MGGSSLRMIQNKSNLFEGDHRVLVGKNAPMQHVLESIYDQVTGDDLASILSMLKSSSSEIKWEYFENITDGQTVIALTQFEYNPLVDKLLVTINGIECYEGVENQFIQTSSSEVTFNFALNSTYKVLIILAGTINSNSFGSNIQEGITLFRQLKDTPKTYAGQGGKVVSINEEETGLTFSLPTAKSSLKEYNSTIHVESSSTYSGWFNFTSKGIIKGIKCSSKDFEGALELKVYTKDVDGYYVYYSGEVFNVLWDIMEIPFLDETGENKIYIQLQNKSFASDFYLQIYVVE